VKQILQFNHNNHSKIPALQDCFSIVYHVSYRVCSLMLEFLKRLTRSFEWIILLFVFVEYYINHQQELLTTEKTTSPISISEVRWPSHEPPHKRALELYIILNLDESTLPGTGSLHLWGLSKHLEYNSFSRDCHILGSWWAHGVWRLVVFLLLDWLVFCILISHSLVYIVFMYLVSPVLATLAPGIGSVV